MTALRRARLASAAMSARSTAAVDSRSSHSAIGNSVSRARFLAKARVDWARGPSEPSMLIGRPSTMPAALGGKREDALGVEAEALARNRFDRRRHAPIRIARGDPDGLAAEIEADERAAFRQQRFGVVEHDNRHVPR